MNQECTIDSSTPTTGLLLLLLMHDRAAIVILYHDFIIVCEMRVTLITITV